MNKLIFLAALSCIVIFNSCAKKAIVRPEPQPEPVVAAVVVSSEPAQAVEPSPRFTDWENTAELVNAYFDYDKAELSEEAREILKKNALFMKENTDLTYLVEGHCDERGTVEYNLALGQRRAATVREYYRVLGVDPSNMATISYGSEKPAVSGTGEAVWAKNRRAETKARKIGQQQ